MTTTVIKSGIAVKQANPFWPVQISSHLCDVIRCFIEPVGCMVLRAVREALFVWLPCLSSTLMQLEKLLWFQFLLRHTRREKTALVLFVTTLKVIRS